MHKINTRPWKIAEIEEEEDDRIVKYEHLVDANGNALEPYIHNADKPTLEFIVKCVNEHDSLVAERNKYRRMLINLCDLGILKGVWKDETLKQLGLLDGEDGGVDE